MPRKPKATPDAKPKPKVKGQRTQMCEHRIPADQHCKRCDA